MTTNNYTIEQAVTQFDSDTLPSELTNPTAPPPTGEAHREKAFHHHNRDDALTKLTQHQHDHPSGSVHHHDRGSTLTQQSLNDTERAKCRRHHHRSIDMGQCRHPPAQVAEEVNEGSSQGPAGFNAPDRIAETRQASTIVEERVMMLTRRVIQSVMDRFRVVTHIGGRKPEALEGPLAQEYGESQI
jgi:hypothetical protein